jgi:hypothetical protein
MHKQGAEFIACDPMTKAMVAEIVGESVKSRPAANA